MNLLLATLTVPVVTGLLGLLPVRRWIKEANLVFGLAVTFSLAIATAGQFLDGSVPTLLGEALRVDGLSALVLVLCAFVGLMSGAYSVGYLRRNEARGLVSPWRRREFDALVPLYVFAMLLVSVSNNLGILWIAVELTTLFSVFLVAFHNRDTSLEAAWKFLVLGSLGLAFALLGTVLLFASGRGVLGEGMEGLNWTHLVALAAELHPLTLKLGVVFALVGYGTKAGLAPMHTWKPDAYREAPSPAGVLMAVGMLNGALYCLLRIHLIAKAALGPGFSGGLLLALGLLSVAVATPFILIQWNLKRLLAYSSIEHVGIMAVGFGLGAEAATFGALLHMTYHTLAKPMSFFSAGTLAQLHASSDFDEIGSGTLGRTPVASALFLLGAVILTGSPPFGMFFSEMTILRAGFAGPHVAASGVFLACLVLLFCGFFYQAGRLVLGEQPEHPVRVPDAERFDAGTATTLLAATLAVVSAFYLPAGLLDLIHAAARVVEGGTMSAPCNVLRGRLGLDKLAELRPGEFEAQLHLEQLPDAADRAVAAGLRLASLFATDEGPTRGFALHQLWASTNPAVFVRLWAPVPGQRPRFPSIAARHPVANWFEREVMDYFGLTPDGHPNQNRVALHDDWPENAWELRKDFDERRPVPRVGGQFRAYRPVTGEGVFHIPVGPVHAGIIEPGHFRFGVAGEPVLYLQVRLFYVHKGIEKRFERLPWRHGLFLAESISGDTAVGHALAYAHAIERLVGLEPPQRARELRVVLLELERVYNHVADIGAIATDVAFTVPASRAQALREGLVRVQERLFGSRLLRGTVALGGVKCDLTVGRRKEILAHLETLEREFDRLFTLLIDSGTFTDRVDNTGVLKTEIARDLGVVGIAARASGLDLDLRRDQPHDAYAGLRFLVPVEEGGDVRARLMVRAREVEQSLSILRQVLESLAEGPVLLTLPDALPAGASALGWAEGWRGECLHWIQTDDAGRLARVKITDPSFKNWPALTRAVPGNIVPDFPVINKSFNLSYSGNDR